SATNNHSAATVASLPIETSRRPSADRRSPDRSNLGRLPVARLRSPLSLPTASIPPTGPDPSPTPLVSGPQKPPLARHSAFPARRCSAWSTRTRHSASPSLLWGSVARRSTRQRRATQATTMPICFSPESWTSFLLDWTVSQRLPRGVWDIADGAQDSIGGSLNVVGMNVERCPITNAAIPPRGDRQYPYPRMVPQDQVADSRPLLRLIQPNHQQVRQGRLHLFQNLRFIGNLADNFNAGLIAQGGQYHVPHQLRAVRHQNPRCLFHELSLARRVSAGPPAEVQVQSATRQGSNSH